MSLPTPAGQPIPDGPPPLANPRKPKIALPPGACDSHCHIYGPFARFPLPPERSFTPNDAPETALRRLHDHLGFARAVIVQSQGHGHDHEPLLDALAVGRGRYRGVALLRPGDNPDLIRRFDAAGICGVRFSFMSHLGFPDLDAVRSVITMVEPYGWHVAIHVAGSGLIDLEDFIGLIPTPVVIDHMARPDIGEGVEGPVVRALLRCLENGRVWVKLSGAERLSKLHAPYEDVAPTVRRLIANAPERLLWGSDWPHVNLHGPMPDDGDLVDFLGRLTTPGLRRRILVDNPAAFFGFPAIDAKTA
ncbi:amidohydrolase family protein [Bradyrhizobium sp. 1]|uniref:amidohydrolase family protein n=1 Tax=Bradyrhizobium sp. 1 TaxID=241591 RepID=UPI001FFBAF5E|nr:amidohydrolase family protein [Bradyrhizobium sp. 1]MCK1395723.1 amidohydrolase family protein [Bradyrhizobium sp. 1]